MANIKVPDNLAAEFNTEELEAVLVALAKVRKVQLPRRIDLLEIIEKLDVTITTWRKEHKNIPDRDDKWLTALSTIIDNKKREVMV